jgi:hypothetical protein
MRYISGTAQLPDLASANPHVHESVPAVDSSHSDAAIALG